MAVPLLHFLFRSFSYAKWLNLSRNPNHLITAAVPCLCEWKGTTKKDQHQHLNQLWSHPLLGGHFEGGKRNDCHQIYLLSFLRELSWQTLIIGYQLLSPLSDRWQFLNRINFRFFVRLQKKFRALKKFQEFSRKVFQRNSIQHCDSTFSNLIFRNSASSSRQM